MRGEAALLGLLSPFSFLPDDAGLTHRSQYAAMAFSFEKLLVYQKSVAFADAVCAATRQFPRGYFFLRDQLNRAALSSATNLAEGNGRFTVADRRQFFGIARGSVRECVPLLEIAVRREVLLPDDHARLRSDLEEISRMVSGLIKGLDRRQREQP
jgi:four helix bundle protein